MKPLTLKVFPRRESTFPTGYTLPRGGYMTIRGADKAAQAKRLTDAELAAEYHQQDAYTEYWMGRTTATHTATNQDRLATLHRFATLPSYDEEDNDV